MDLNKPNTENLAGIKSLKFIDSKYVNSVENGLIDIKPGFTLNKVHTVIGKWNFTGDLNKDSSSFYDFKLNGVISGHDKMILANTVLMSEADLILVIELENISYIAGNPDEGIHFLFSNFSGSIPGDDTGYNLTFFRKMRRGLVVKTA